MKSLDNNLLEIRKRRSPAKAKRTPNNLSKKPADGQHSCLFTQSNSTEKKHQASTRFMNLHCAIFSLEKKRSRPRPRGRTK